MRTGRIIILAGLFIISGNYLLSAQETFSEFCGREYMTKKDCPTAVCGLQCEDGSMTEGCSLACVPRRCEKLSEASCPLQFCQLVTDCAKQKLCLPKTEENTIPGCGDLAYNGQDVECCKGLVKKCGFDYFDGTCNMTGKNSPYNLPICIPCGDGKCTNFENHCNCPEDCTRDYLPEE